MIEQNILVLIFSTPKARDLRLDNRSKLPRKINTLFPTKFSYSLFIHRPLLQYNRATNSLALVALCLAAVDSHHKRRPAHLGRPVEGRAVSALTLDCRAWKPDFERVDILRQEAAVHLHSLRRVGDWHVCWAVEGQAFGGRSIW